MDGPTGVKADRSHTSQANRRREEAAKQEQKYTMTRQDMVISWEARKGSSTALAGLGRGGEALAEAQEAMELAGQVGERVRCLACANVRQKYF